MVRVAIAGCSGRMGQSLIATLVDGASGAADHGSSPRLVLAAVSERAGHPWVGQPCPTPVAIPREAIVDDESRRVVADLREAGSFDVLIDFTHPIALSSHLEVCAARRARLVLGTTGLSAEQEQALAAFATKTPVVHAPNMGVGTNLLFHLARVAAEALGDSVDVEVIEAHHRHKVDAPSGTALKLGRIVAQATGRQIEDCAVFGREGQTGARDRATIGFATIRAGDIVGEHTVMFATDGERIELTHRASARSVFALGALRAARWIASKSEPGLFDMLDVLNLRATSG
ncbi:MAG: 4-hydroxy-tetrahydrodipicolinate reductase [Thioalkalivibrionaceae bacterium]